MTRLRTSLVLIASGLILSACAPNPTPELMNLRQQSSAPDEFSILPTKPLEQPEDYTNLPAPTLGGPNRADRNPQEIAANALGGRVDAGAGADQGLVNTATRYGVASNIRETLAAEDLEFRQKNDGRLLERVFNVNVYYKAYRRQALDRYAELERMRRAGIRTPAAPPLPVAE